MTEEHAQRRELVMLRLQLDLYRLVHRLERFALETIAEVGDDKSKAIASAVIITPEGNSTMPKESGD